MKLIGSQTEQRMRDEIVRATAALQGGGHERLASALDSAGICLDGACLINWIPEQGEDIYVILASGREIVTAEVPREGLAPVALARTDLADYRRRCSKVQRMKLAVAQAWLKSGKA